MREAVNVALGDLELRRVDEGLPPTCLISGSSFTGSDTFVVTRGVNLRGSYKKVSIQPHTKGEKSRTSVNFEDLPFVPPRLQELNIDGLHDRYDRVHSRIQNNDRRVHYWRV
jgi:hypothetical protein